MGPTDDGVYTTSVSFKSEPLCGHVELPREWRIAVNPAAAGPRSQGRAARVRTNHRRRGSRRQTRAGPDDGELPPEHVAASKLREDAWPLVWDDEDEARP